jgi:hypothetical protein
MISQLFVTHSFNVTNYQETRCIVLFDRLSFKMCLQSIQVLCHLMFEIKYHSQTKQFLCKTRNVCVNTDTPVLRYWLNPLPDIHAYLLLFHTPPFVVSNGEKMPYSGLQHLFLFAICCLKK